MIENFEDETSDLTAEEFRLSAIILNQLRSKYNSETHCIKQDEIIRRMKSKGYKISGSRLRKIFNYARSKGEPIIATSKGCWYTNSLREIESQIRSLKDRRKALEAPINGLTKLLSNKQQQLINNV